MLEKVTNERNHAQTQADEQRQLVSNLTSALNEGAQTCKMPHACGSARSSSGAEHNLRRTGSRVHAPPALKNRRYPSSYCVSFLTAERTLFRNVTDNMRVVEAQQMQLFEQLTDAKTALAHGGPSCMA